MDDPDGWCHPPERLDSIPPLLSVQMVLLMTEPVKRRLARALPGKPVAPKVSDIEAGKPAVRKTARGSQRKRPAEPQLQVYPILEQYAAGKAWKDALIRLSVALECFRDGCAGILQSRAI
jgi:hypothetical protein